MRPFLVFAPRGPIPESLETSLSSVGAEVLLAVRPAEVASLLVSHSPGLLLVVPPATMADAASLLPHLERQGNPPPIFVLTADAHARPFALELVGAEPWHRAAADLSNGSSGAGSAILVSRSGLVRLLDLWERLHLDRPAEGIHQLVLPSISQALQA